MFARVCSCVVVVAASLSGCATPGVTLVSWEPSPALEPRGADRLVLVDAEGRASAKRAVAAIARAQASGRFFRVEDRGGSGVKLTLAGKTASIEGAASAPRDNELWLRIDVLRWDAEPVVLRDEDADDGPVDVPGLRGHADLQFTVARSDGEVVIREREVRGVADIEIDPDGVINARDEERAIITAARIAVDSILDELSPQRRTSSLAFDTGDGAQKKILESELTLHERERRLRRYLKKNKGNAIAMHNLAIVLTAQGRFEDALAMHDAAIAIVNRDGFFAAKAETDRRRTMWIRMFGPRPSDAAAATTTTTAPAETATTTPSPETATPAETAPPAP